MRNQIRLSGIQAKTSFEIGERHYSTLGPVFRKVCFSQPSLQEMCALSSTVKAMKDIMGENGLATIRIFF